MKYDRQKLTEVFDKIDSEFDSITEIIQQVFDQNERYRAALELIRDEGEPSDWYELIIQALKLNEEFLMTTKKPKPKRRWKKKWVIYRDDRTIVGLWNSLDEVKRAIDICYLAGQPMEVLVIEK